MINEYHVVNTLDGHQISVLVNRPSEPIASLVMCHGLGSTMDEGRGLYVEFAAMMANEGVTCFRFDFRGHGTSSLQSLELTLSGEVEDLNAVLNLVVESSEECPIGVLASSFSAGPAIAVSQASNCISSLALWNPVIDYRSTFVEPETTWGKSLLLEAELLDGVAGKLPGKEFPLSFDLYKEMRHANYSDVLSELPIPLFVAHGCADTKVPFKFVKAVVDRRRENNLSTSSLFIEGEDHGFANSRPKLMQETKLWISQTLSSGKL